MSENAPPKISLLKQDLMELRKWSVEQVTRTVYGGVPIPPDAINFAWNIEQYVLSGADSFLARQPPTQVSLPSLQGLGLPSWRSEGHETSHLHQPFSSPVGCVATPTVDEPGAGENPASGENDRGPQHPENDAVSAIAEPKQAFDYDDRINLRRLATAAVLWRLVDGLEKAYGPAHQDLYEVHLARGLAKALDELAKSSLEPGLASFIEAPVSKRAEQFLNSAESWAGDCDGAA